MQKNWKNVVIGRVSLDPGKPTIITSLFSEDSASLISLLSSDRRLKSRLLEIRYDLFAGRSARDLHRILGYLGENAYSYVFTYRSSSQSETEMYYGIAADNSAPAVDIDISQIMWAGEHKFVIASYHGTQGDVTQDLLQSLREQMSQAVKLAISYASKEAFLSDLATVTKFFDFADKPVCFSPMGEFSFMREVAAYFISDLVYASYRIPTAEGQVTEDRLRKVLDLF